MSSIFKTRLSSTEADKGLFAACLVLAALIPYFVFGQSGVLDFAFSAITLFLFSMLVGTLLMAVYGMPVYSQLSKRQLASYFSVAIAGAIPGLPLLLDAEFHFFGIIFIVYGVFVALLVHFFTKRARP